MVTTVLLDTFTAANGTDPTTRDVDTHPVITGAARWRAPTGMPGEIQSNRLTYNDLSVLLQLRGDGSETIVSTFPFFLLMAFDVTTVPDRLSSISCSVSSAGASDVGMVYEKSGETWSLLGYADGDSAGAYLHEITSYPDGPHVIGVYVTDAGAWLIADGEVLDTAATTMTGASLNKMNLLMAPNSPDAMTVDKVALYTDLTLDEAIAMTGAVTPTSTSTNPVMLFMM